MTSPLTPPQNIGCLGHVDDGSRIRVMADQFSERRFAEVRGLKNRAQLTNEALRRVPGG